MDQNGAVSFRFPSSDRFLGVLSPPPPSTATASAGDELNEDDIFFSGDFPDTQPPSPTQAKNIQSPFRQPELSGILAALPETNRKSDHNRPVLVRKPSLPSSPSPSTTPFNSRPIPPVPKPDFNHSRSVPARRFQQSAPVNVPMMPRKALAYDDEDDLDEEIVPPHEMVARGRSTMTTFSMLEGAGRTLKGRDLRQVRNAVWRQTGFLD